MYKVTLSSFIVEDKNDHSKDVKYELVEGIELSVDKIRINEPDKEFSYEIFNDEFNIVGCGDTIEDAILDAEADLAETFVCYMRANDADLTKKAKAIKYKLMNTIKKVIEK